MDLNPVFQRYASRWNLTGKIRQPLIVFIIRTKPAAVDIYIFILSSINNIILSLYFRNLLFEGTLKVHFNSRIDLRTRSERHTVLCAIYGAQIITYAVTWCCVRWYSVLIFEVSVAVDTTRAIVVSSEFEVRFSFCPKKFAMVMSL